MVWSTISRISYNWTTKYLVHLHNFLYSGRLQSFDFMGFVVAPIFFRFTWKVLCLWCLVDWNSCWAHGFNSHLSNPKRISYRIHLHTHTHTTHMQPPVFGRRTCIYLCGTWVPVHTPIWFDSKTQEVVHTHENTNPQKMSRPSTVHTHTHRHTDTYKRRYITLSTIGRAIRFDCEPNKKVNICQAPSKQ